MALSARSSFHGIAGALAQVRTVFTLAVAVGQLDEAWLVDEAHAVGDFFDTGDASALPLLQDVHELAGLDQAFMCARVEPCHAATHELHPGLALADISAGSVPEFELS